MIVWGWFVFAATEVAATATTATAETARNNGANDETCLKMCTENGISKGFRFGNWRTEIRRIADNAGRFTAILRPTVRMRIGINN